jgi:hypothetical protein
MARVAPTLTGRHLNRATLARQLLLERASTSVPAVLEQIGGIQAQYAPSMYVGLWSRLEAFERADLTRALERRQVVQGTLLRATIHLVSAADYWRFALAVREARRSHWLRTSRHDDSAEEMEALAGRVRARLEEQSPLSRKELGDLAGSAHRVNGVGLWLDLVRVPPSGTWERRRADLYAAAEDWLGPPPKGLDADRAVDHLVRRYLVGFGPATAAEIANWAGLPPAVVAAAVSRLTLRRFQAEDGVELVDLPRAPTPDADAPAPVRFLPVWDAILLAHARRAGVLAEEHRPKVFDPKTPHSLNTFLVDGEVAGTWRFEQAKVEIEPFAPLDAAARRQLAEEAERLAAFHG